MTLTNGVSMSHPQEEMSTKFYLLPCLFTLSSLFCGFYAILSATKGEFVVSAIAIIVAAVFDGLDGRVARMTGKTSMFGVELDSLCDNVSFGVAPGLLAYFWALQPYGRYGWLAAFLYIATTTLRLARFNSQQTDSVNFIGLPCPAAAAMISSAVLFCHSLGIEGPVKHISLLFLVYLLSYLMVSNHSYCSFKKMQHKGRTFPILVGALLLFILVAAEPQIMFFAIFVLYIASGMATDLWKWAQKSSLGHKLTNKSKQ
ncbi:probable CDP-diacylglycerol--serine O-phosphatidyltransferase [Desulfotalea psychrophila LSv54]|uniref:CDP-diacylglycerol--serine O-phosphatidyltransferase n=2 Tax=Desulfotalea psychrophila TaxID=84980 RepID=Q6AJH9_DESPS|nr:probable CDP-diacylglycerol--serine O-phosphatidyltransferase [Desulfotalea psychrophila LSv54]